MFWCQVNIAPAMLCLGLLLLTTQALVKAYAPRHLFSRRCKFSTDRTLPLPIVSQPVSRTPGSFEC